MTKQPRSDNLKKANLETLQQHIDALNILTNLLLAELAESNPDGLGRILQRLRQAIDTTPQLHPELREALEARYMTFMEALRGIGNRH